jgi:hypothetical protein
VKVATVALAALTFLGHLQAIPLERRGPALQGPESTASGPQDDAYLHMGADRAIALGKSMREDGRVGGWFDTRILSTDRSYSYKLRATWLTPEVIRAAARLEQLRNYLTDDATRQLVAEAEAAGDTVLMVEVDPQEGSGVIPLDWVTLLQPRREDERISDPVRGTSIPRLRRVKALAGVEPRDYDYSVFWVVFPLVHEDGSPLFTDAHEEAELIVRIYEKEGRVHWRIPQSIRDRAAAIQKPIG